MPRRQYFPWMAAAPGPRAVKLAQVMQLALDRTLGALPQETFLGCFPAEVRTVAGTS